MSFMFKLLIFLRRNFHQLFQTAPNLEYLFADLVELCIKSIID